MFYTIYKTTNLINHKYYIGKHQTMNINDTYLGSGIAIFNAIKKYGKNNFRKEILFVFDNEHDMNLKEKELVNEQVVNDPMSYNETIGGEGGPAFTGKHHSEETKKILSERYHSYSTNHPEQCHQNHIKAAQISNCKRKSWTDEQKKQFSDKMSKSLREYYQSDKRKSVVDEIRKKISKSIQEHYRSKGRIPLPSKRELKVDKSIITSKKRIAIHKNDKEIRIFPEELNWYLNDGWLVGRSPALVDKISSSLKGKFTGISNSIGGCVSIYNETLMQIKMVRNEELDSFLRNGWKKGNPGKRWLKEGFQKINDHFEKIS